MLPDKLSIGADSVGDIVHELGAIARELQPDRPTASVTGGVSWGGVWSHAVDLNQTHETYERELELYLQHQRGEVGR